MNNRWNKKIGYLLGIIILGLSLTAFRPQAIYAQAPQAAPVFSLSASCTPNAQGTFVISNIGGNMTGPGTWTLNLNGTPIASNNFQLNAGASTSVNTSGLYGTLQLSVSGGGSVGTVSASTFCQSPTATPVPTSTPTPVPPTFSLSADCTPAAAGTFTIKNTGGNMTGPGTWTLNLNGTPIASNNFQLNGGATTSINTSGLYGTLQLIVTGGGSVGTVSASTFCQSPTATPTSTPSATPIPPIFSVSASCNPAALGTFTITDIGSKMTIPGSWTLDLNGTPIASNNFQLNSGASMNINTAGLFGTLELNVSGGGSVGTKSASTFCQFPFHLFLPDIRH